MQCINIWRQPLKTTQVIDSHAKCDILSIEDTKCLLK